MIFGGHSGEVPPVPIPNTEVKLSSADGTARATVWESRSLPIFLYNGKPGYLIVSGFFCLFIALSPTPCPRPGKSSLDYREEQQAIPSMAEKDFVNLPMYGK